MSITARNNGLTGNTGAFSRPESTTVASGPAAPSLPASPEVKAAPSPDRLVKNAGLERSRAAVLGTRAPALPPSAHTAGEASSAVAPRRGIGQEQVARGFARGVPAAQPNTAWSNQWKDSLRTGGTGGQQQVNPRWDDPKAYPKEGTLAAALYAQNHNYTTLGPAQRDADLQQLKYQVNKQHVGNWADDGRAMPYHIDLKKGADGHVNAVVVKYKDQQGREQRDVIPLPPYYQDMGGWRDTK